MPALITIANLQANRPVSESVKPRDIQSSLDYAEQVELPKLIGNAFYADLFANPTGTANGNYPKLLDGGTYTYDGDTYTFRGVKQLLYDLAYANYLQMSRETDTPFGQQIHTFINGQQSPTDRLNLKYKAVRNAAMETWHQIFEYLERMSASTSTRYKYWQMQIPENTDEIIPNRFEVTTIM